MRKSTKNSLIVIFIILLFSTIFFLLFGLKLIKKSKVENVIIVGNEAVFRQDGFTWKNVRFQDLKNYNWKKYNTYVDHSYYGKYNLYYNEKWYLFQNKNEAVNYEGELLALGGNIKYKIVDFKVHDIKDFTFVKQVLKDNHLKEDSILTASSFVNIDLDHNGRKDQLYMISNQFPLEDVGDTYFSFIYMVRDNRIIYLYKNIEKKEDPYSGCKPYISNILDINEDDKYEVIVSCGYYSNNGVLHKMYQFDQDQFKLLVSN